MESRPTKVVHVSVGKVAVDVRVLVVQIARRIIKKTKTLVTQPPGTGYSMLILHFGELLDHHPACAALAVLQVQIKSNH